ncbi:TonB-dependent receptor plug domain-containing protein [Stakelama tenebrarum]|uniref:TonB-dependent receptor n=1 Tax=Stakelama tenebrarum TaxID=2711215 RepID=A0A6G6Y2Z9_9SPHN|nr:TonB-dependent receptor [Sphingosinithalassobacter tenebrarum]QIG79324.1 TonB-dependent receptor [Sphingosinithalassobacter tenebrarum]
MGEYRRIAWLASAVLVVGAAPAYGQDSLPAPVDNALVQEEPSAEDHGVLVYDQAFFAGYSPATAYDMIDRIPGFSLDVGSSSTRGLAGAAGNVLIDGDVPASKSDRIDEILARMPASNVERIELVRGGAPGIDMHGYAVVANVVRKRAATSQWVTDLNSYIYPDGGVGPQARLTYTRSEGERQTQFSIYGTRDRTGTTSHGSRVRTDVAGNLIQSADLDTRDRIYGINLRGTIVRPTGGGGKLRLNALVGLDTSDIRQDFTVVAGSGANEHNEASDRDWSGELGATWSRPIGGDFEIELTGLQRLGRYLYDQQSASGGRVADFSLRSTSGESVGRAILRYKPEEEWAFEGGGEIAYNFLDSTTGYLSNGARVALPNESVYVSELRGEGFVQATWKAGDSLTLEAGVRAEVSRIAQNGDTDQSKSFFYPKPRLQLTWVPGEGHQVRLRYEHVLGQLDFDDFVASSEIELGTVAGGNADLKPQQTTVYEASYEYRFWGKGVVSALYQHYEYEDIVDFIPLTDGYDAVGNIGSGSGDFLETSATLPFDRLGLKGVQLYLRAAWYWTRATDPLTGESRRISGTSAFGCAVNLNHDIDDGRWSWGVQHGCDVDKSTTYRVREFRDYRLPPLVTVYVQWKPTSDWTIRLEGGNVTDVTETYVRDIYSGPRNNAPLLYRERRETQFDPWLYLKIRKRL